MVPSETVQYRSLASLGIIDNPRTLVDPDPREKVSPRQRARAQRWLVGAGLGILGICIATSNAHAEQPLTIKTQCVDASIPSYQPNTMLPPRIEVTIDGSFKKSSGRKDLVEYKPQHSAPADYVYMIITDNKENRQYVVNNTSVDQTTIGTTLDGYLRGQSRTIVPAYNNFDEAQKRFIKPFNTYTITIGTAAFTESGFPQIREVLGEAAFSATCTSTSGGQILPEWSIPEFTRLYPMPHPLQGPLPKEY